MSRPKLYKPTKKHLQLCFDAGYFRIKRAKLFDSLGISKGQYYKYTILNEQYKKGVEAGLPNLHLSLKNSLYKQCFKRTIKEITRNGKGEIVKTVIKTLEPNGTLLMFALVNAMPEEFQSINKEKIIIDREKQVINLSYSKFLEN